MVLEAADRGQAGRPDLGLHNRPPPPLAGRAKEGEPGEATSFGCSDSGCEEAGARCAAG